MRVVEEIPHPHFKITIFAWNAKYIIKIEAGQFEQSFKISEMDVSGVGDVKKMLSAQFMENVTKRFIEMRKDFAEAYANV